MSNFVAFDIETNSFEIPKEEMQIICARVGEVEWCEKEHEVLQKDALYFLYRHLIDLWSVGVKIVGWNSLSFDFFILNRLLKGYGSDGRFVQEMALDHYDIMFQFMSMTGYPVGLDAVARGFGIGGKTEGMDGATAPVLWREGKKQEVLAYLENDVALTLAIAEKIEKEGEVCWITKAGNLRVREMGKLLTVRESMQLKMPDNSWMDNPLKREDFIAWALP